jgi:hypothetical protein
MQSPPSTGVVILLSRGLKLKVGIDQGLQSDQ